MTKQKICKWCKMLLKDENHEDKGVTPWTLEAYKAECFSCHQEIYLLTKDAKEEFATK